MAAGLKQHVAAAAVAVVAMALLTRPALALEAAIQVQDNALAIEADEVVFRLPGAEVRTHSHSPSPSHPTSHSLVPLSLSLSCLSLTHSLISRLVCGKTNHALAGF